MDDKTYEQVLELQREHAAEIKCGVVGQIIDSLRFAVEITEPIEQDSIVESWNWVVKVAHEASDALEAQEARIKELEGAIRPFVEYTPKACLQGKGKWALVPTKLSGGGWFGAEDFRKAALTL